MYNFRSAPRRPFGTLPAIATLLCVGGAVAAVTVRARRVARQQRLGAASRGKRIVILGSVHLVALQMGVALLPSSCMLLPHEGALFHPLAETVYSKTHLLWRKDVLSRPLQHYIRIVGGRFENHVAAQGKTPTFSHPKKKLALAAKLEGVVQEIAAS